MARALQQHGGYRYAAVRRSCEGLKFQHTTIALPSEGRVNMVAWESWWPCYPRKIFSAPSNKHSAEDSRGGLAYRLLWLP